MPTFPHSKPGNSVLTMRNATDERNTIIVATSKGNFTGRIISSVPDSNPFTYFKQIPYARIPIGPRRFAPPEDYTSIDDDDEILMAFEKEPYLKIAENLLHLDIFTPKVEKRDYEKHDMAVIVFIPGDIYRSSGCFHLKYLPKLWMKEEIVVAVVSYRVGLLGFTRFADPLANAPGDVGLMDLKAAFAFVRNEIKNFGGCPENITAYGQGLGATHVRHLLMSQLFDNCFDKMILSSCIEHHFPPWLANNGNLIGGVVVYYLNTRVPFGGDPRNDVECVEYLRNLPIGNINHFAATMTAFYMDEQISDQMLRELTRQVYRVDMPVIIGYNSAESLFDREQLDGNNKPVYECFARFLDNHGAPTLAANKEDFARVFDMDNIEHSPRAPLTRHILPEYLQCFAKLGKDERVIEVYYNDDLKYLIGIFAIARRLASNRSNVYLYRFDVKSDGFYPGTPFQRELEYTFSESPLYGSDGVCKTVVEYWARFAKTGDPNPRDGNLQQLRLNLHLHQHWYPIRIGIEHCMTFKDRSTYYRIPELNRMLFWETHKKFKFFSRPI